MKLLTVLVFLTCFVQQYMCIEYANPDDVREFKINDPVTFLNPIKQKIRFDNIDGEIPEDTFSTNMDKIMTLEIFPNVTYIQPGAFRGLDKLQTLNLQSNKIRYLLKFTFRGAANLRHLNLAGNRINYIDHQAFYDLPNLEDLDLSHNYDLMQIRSNAFYGLIGLQKLKLNDCSIKTIQTNGFNTLSKLVKLDLSNNKLERITGEDLVGCPTVKNIYLSRNKIRFIDGKQFGESLHYLRIIDVTENPISDKDACYLVRLFERRASVKTSSSC